MKEKSVFSNKAFVSMCCINFVMNMGQFMANAILPKFADSLGATPTMVGTLTSIFSLTSMFMKPFSGPAIDSFKKKWILCGGYVFLLLAYSGYSMANSVGLLFVARLLHGCAYGITIIACLSMVSDALPEEKLTSGIAYYSMIQALATAIGPMTGLRLSACIGFRSTFMVSIILILAAMVLVIRWNVPEKGEKTKFAISLKTCVAVEAIPSAMVTMCLGAAYVNISSFLVLYAESIGVEGIDLYFTVYAIALLVSRPFVGKMSEKYGIMRVLPVTISIFSLALFMLGTARVLPVFLLAAIAMAFGYGACHPLMQALSVQSVPPERRGSASATNYYGTDIGYLLMPMFSGYIVENVSYGAMFRIVALIPLAGLAILLIMRKRIKPAVRNETI